jgi:hypothetical protein
MMRTLLILLAAPVAQASAVGTLEFGHNYYGPNELRITGSSALDAAGALIETSWAYLSMNDGERSVAQFVHWSASGTTADRSIEFYTPSGGWRALAAEDCWQLTDVESAIVGPGLSYYACYTYLPTGVRDGAGWYGVRGMSIATAAPWTNAGSPLSFGGWSLATVYTYAGAPHRVLQLRSGLAAAFDAATDLGVVAGITSVGDDASFTYVVHEGDDALVGNESVYLDAAAVADGVLNVDGSLYNGTFSLSGCDCSFLATSVAGIDIDQFDVSDMLATDTTVKWRSGVDFVAMSLYALSVHDPDSDRDGLGDSLEVYSAGTDPGVPDTDGDGCPDGTENPTGSPTVGTDGSDPLDPDDSICADHTGTDTDGDGVPDTIEETIMGTDPGKADTDDDGILDGREDRNWNGVRDRGETDPLEADTDDDELPDGVEDADKDGLGDLGETNPTLPDTDHDGLSDGVEDADADGSYDSGETDPRNADTDGDGLLDGWEDKDHSGSWDAGETNPRDYDTDDGGVSDGAEDVDHDGFVDPGETDPLEPSDDVARDLDGDGIPDDVEGRIGTDPDNPDSDHDSLLDGVEDKNQDGEVDDDETDPKNADTDEDGIEDGAEDQDHDGEVDAGELDPKTKDTDRDGLPDGVEDGDHDGLVDAGETDGTRADTDNDGLQDGVEDRDESGSVDAGETDPLDPDSDDGGVIDGDEDRNHDGVVDEGETDPLHKEDDRGTSVLEPLDTQGDGQGDPAFGGVPRKVIAGGRTFGCSAVAPIWGLVPLVLWRVRRCDRRAKTTRAAR